MTSRKILGDLLKGAIELGSETTVLGVSTLNIAHETNIADLSIPIVGDYVQALRFIPFSEIFIGTLKIINAFRIAYTGYKSYDNVLITKNYINSIFEFISGCTLISSFAAYKLSVFHSIWFSYIGFSISAFVDLIESTVRVFQSYKHKDCRSEFVIPDSNNNYNEKIEERFTTKYIDKYNSAIADCFVNILKCIGWGMLCYSSILSAGTIMITIGWILVGIASLLQVLRCLNKTGSLFKIGFFGSHSSKNKEYFEEKKHVPSALSVSNISDITDLLGGTPISMSSVKETPMTTNNNNFIFN